jgi:SNF2 family DNA or RNA helicase
MMFYESPVSPIIREQAECRCYRRGQQCPVFISDLYANHSVEHKILRFLKEGRDLLKELVSGGLGVLTDDSADLPKVMGK